VHLLLYGLMIAMPLTGYAMVDAKGYDIPFFGLTAPDFLGKNEPLADTLKELHGVLGWMLAAAIGAHAGAALWHHFVVRDDVLGRMLGAGERDARLR
jgi:superoxide oxidase